MNNERMLNALDQLKALYTNNVGGYRSTEGVDASAAFFANGQAVFYPGRLSAAVEDDLRKMEEPYGILPYPKLDAEQEGYVSLIHSSSGVIAMPNSVPAERVGRYRGTGCRDLPQCCPFLPRLCAEGQVLPR